jgi:hypothetical protein
MRDNCDKGGMTFEAIRMDSEYIMLPKGERDRRLDAIMGNIQKASQVGVKVITHHWTVIPIRRNGQRPGRGGVTSAAFKLEDNWRELPVGKAGRVSSDEYWERITYFLQKVIPVCKQYDVRMAAHPWDPPGLRYRNATATFCNTIRNALGSTRSVPANGRSIAKIRYSVIAIMAASEPVGDMTERDHGRPHHASKGRPNAVLGTPRAVGQQQHGWHNVGTLLRVPR